MAVLEVLTEVIGAKEFLRLIAFAEFVHVLKMVDTVVPVRMWVVGELLSTIAANVHSRYRVHQGRGVVGCNGTRRVESSFVLAGQSGTRPGMTAKVKGVLMTFSLVLVFEPIVTEVAAILLF